MTLLNAPEFDAQKETRRRNILIGSGVGIALLAVLSLAGFLLGHGWLFTNLPVEHKVSVFFSALQSQDYPRAYGLFYNDANWQQHPEKVQGLHAKALYRRLYDGERLEGACWLIPRRLLQARRNGYGSRREDQRHNEPDAQISENRRHPGVLSLRAILRAIAAFLLAHKSAC